MFPRGLALLSMMFLLVSGTRAMAVVESIDANIQAEVRRISPVGVEVDEAFKDLSETASNLPIDAEARFELSAPEKGNAGAVALTTFTDPRLSVNLNPAEFGIFAAGAGDAPGVSHLCTSQATETRQIMFTSADVGEAEGTLVQARSYFFLDGLLVIWGRPGNISLDGTWSTISIEVTQTRAVDASPVTVLNASLSMRGTADGGLTLEAEGDLSTDNVVLIDAEAQVPELGAAFVVLLPSLAIPYLYEATVGESFTLKARIEGSLSQVPGTGSAVLLGQSSLDLLAQLDNLIAELEATSIFSESLTQLRASRAVPAVPLSSEDLQTKITVVRRVAPMAFCGGLGAEAALSFALLSGLVGGLPYARRRSRR